jgi:hypothetical protein
MVKLPPSIQTMPGRALPADANQHRQLALCHSDKDALHADPSPHMSIDIGRFDAQRGSLTGGRFMGRSISKLRLAGFVAKQSCHGGLATTNRVAVAGSREGRILLEVASILL